MSLSKEDEEEATLLIRQATTDLEEFFCKIKKSKKMLKFKDKNPELLTMMLLNMLGAFSLMQIIEISGKAKIIDNDLNKELNRQERFCKHVEMFKGAFDYIQTQQLMHMVDNDER